MEPDSRREKESESLGAITNRPDDWLLREWKSGDERAAEVLFDRYALRLVALVASRLNRRFQSSIDPGEVVQSAMGSFFDAARHSRIQVSGSVSLWRLLATFARRKMARSIERQSAAKRGGDRERLSLDQVQPETSNNTDVDTDDGVEELIATLKTELTDDLYAIVEGLLAGQTQRQLAGSLGIDERTVRRRILRVRELIAAEPAADTVAIAASSPPALPRVNYSEFVLGKLIGSGGFGKVYRARLQSDERVVAVKFLRKAFWQIEDARQTFLREISVASQVSHPGVISYRGYGESPHGGPYVISEWIDGRSLQHATVASEQQLIGWLLQVCAAIQAVHQAGLVHGDLTPGNVLVDAEDRITITDFGFSQATSETALPILGGTLGFAAPEQIDSAFGSISEKTDVYAIGGLLHWLLFAKPPNAGQRFEQAMSATLGNAEPQASTFSMVSKRLRKILVNTLRKFPADRSMSLADIIHELSGAEIDNEG